MYPFSVLDAFDIVVVVVLGEVEERIIYLSCTVALVRNGVMTDMSLDLIMTSCAGRVSSWGWCRLSREADFTWISH